ncbi:MAG: hypothetical protein JNK15_04255 [Planctomycetes bacterium]|nr:hypothetical protein [Planctomycetota bacterium]
MNHHESSRGLAYAHARRTARTWVDRYRPEGKLYPVVCPACGAAECRGRWTWDQAPADLPRVLCPACERLRDGVAAHELVLCGDLQRWWPEVRGLLRHVERAETATHPLERVMAIVDGDDGVHVTTTGMHMARRLVAALVRRFRRGVRIVFEDSRTILEWR